MAKIPVDEAPAGSEMDAAVAKLLGCKVSVYPPGEPAPYFCGCGEGYPHGDSVTVGLRRYSTDIAAAWELVSKIPSDGYTKLTVWEYGYAECLVSKLATDSSEGFERFEAGAITAPLAICRAFLKANGVEHLEVGE